MAQPGLRERKKQRTRATIIEVAFRLFAEQGYHETTLVQIADAAEIAPSTFFNYFPGKVDIVFGLAESIIDSASARILGRIPTEPAVNAIVEWVSEDLLEVERPYAEVLRVMPKIVDSVPELVAEQRRRWTRLDDIFAEAFAVELGEPVDGIRARVMSTIAMRGMVEVWNAWYEQHASDVSFDPSEVIALKAEFLEKALRAGLVAIRTLPAPPDES